MRLAPHEYARRHGKLHNALRSCLDQFDYQQARDFQALRPEAFALHLAGILCDSGVSLDAFEDLAATSSVVRDALAKACRWRAIPIEIGATHVRCSGAQPAGRDAPNVVLRAAFPIGAGGPQPCAGLDPHCHQPSPALPNFGDAP